MYTATHALAQVGPVVTSRQRPLSCAGENIAIRKINSFIVACSQSWWKFLLLALCTIGAMGFLLKITDDFPAAANGAIPFDMQNSLTQQGIFEQLAGYSERALELYWRFQLVDYLFPLAAGLLLASACAFSLRRASPEVSAAVNAKCLFVLLLVPAVVDWLENLCFALVIWRWPEQASAAAGMALLFKQLKLATLALACATTGVLVLWAGLVTLQAAAGRSGDD